MGICAGIALFKTKIERVYLLFFLNKAVLFHVILNKHAVKVVILHLELK